jgi:F-type H+-transporting ATPase subunit c
MAYLLLILRDEFENGYFFSKTSLRTERCGLNYCCPGKEKEMLRKSVKWVFTLLTSVAALLVSSPVVFAAEAIPEDGSYIKVIFAVGAMVGAGLAIGMGAIGAGAGIGNAASGACSAVGRNPGVQGKIMMTMLVGMAMAESIAIYALVVSLVLLYANPYKAFLFG